MSRHIARRRNLGLGCLLLAVWWAAACGGSDPATQDDSADGVAPELPATEQGRQVDLYFPRGDRLFAEARELPNAVDPEKNIVAVVEALIAGPSSDNLRAPLADDLEVGGVYVLDGGLVSLDLRSTDGQPPTSTGSQREMLIVYSLVNSVLLNHEGADRLLLTWNGRQLPTFAGQLDISRPLAPNLDLIAR